MKVGALISFTIKSILEEIQNRQNPMDKKQNKTKYCSLYVAGYYSQLGRNKILRIFWWGYNNFFLFTLLLENGSTVNSIN